MLTKLKLKNFENHLDSSLEFIPGLNIITGISNTGKSSIVRAINWVVNNQPSGDSYINNQKDECEVIIEIHGKEIKKYRNRKNEHRYIIDNETLTALKRQVPEKIKNTVSFSDMNLRNQFDRFFLLQDSPGEVAKKLNNIIDLSIMDDSIRLIKAKVNRKSRYIENLETQIIVKKEELSNYKWLDKAESVITNIIENTEKLKKMKEKRDEIDVLVLNMCSIDSFLDSIDNKLSNKKHIFMIQKIIKKFEEFHIIYNELFLLDKKLSTYKYISVYISIISIIKQKIQELAVIEDTYKLVNEIEDTTIIISNQKNEIMKLKNEIEDFKEKYKICPFCGQEIINEVIE